MFIESPPLVSSPYVTPLRKDPRGNGDVLQTPACEGRSLQFWQVLCTVTGCGRTASRAALDLLMRRTRVAM